MIRGIDGTDRLVDVPSTWPTLHVTQGGEPPALGKGDRHEVFDFGNGAVMTMDQIADGFRVHLAVGGVIPPDHLAHPYLSFPAAVANHWSGRETFHAGGVLIGGAVWALCGRPGAGKTSTLAQLLRCGHQVTTDDLLIVDGQVAFTGPRCLDLRGETAGHLGVGSAMGVVGTRERWRVALDPVAAAHPFGGWVYLGWGDELHLSPVATSDRLRRVFEQDGLGWGPADPARYLELATLPAWDLTRPRELVGLDGVGDLLTEHLAAAARG